MFYVFVSVLIEYHRITSIEKRRFPPLFFCVSFFDAKTCEISMPGFSTEYEFQGRKELIGPCFLFLVGRYFLSFAISLCLHCGIIEILIYIPGVFLKKSE